MKKDESDPRNNEVLQDEIKGAVETNRDIKETVRRITSTDVKAKPDKKSPDKSD